MPGRDCKVQQIQFYPKKKLWECEKPSAFYLVVNKQLYIK